MEIIEIRNVVFLPIHYDTHRYLYKDIIFNLKQLYIKKGKNDLKNFISDLFNNHPIVYNGVSKRIMLELIMYFVDDEGKIIKNKTKQKI